MAKRQAARRARPSRSASSARKTARSVKRPKAKLARKATARKASRRLAHRRGATSAARKAAPRPKARAVVRPKAKPAGRPAAKAAVAPKAKRALGRAKTPRLERARRTLDERGVPSSLDMVRQGSSVRTGRAEIEEKLVEHRGMGESIKGGDVDVDVEDAYFTGDEAPGGDNPTPDQDIVDDIGKALGVQYQDNEELRPTDKVEERDKHRWELDPASSEDYRNRK